jgi:hypothetical protein
MSAPIDAQHELFGFLTTEANAIVAPVHAMPVILTMPDEIDLWLEGDTPDALTLQRPLPDDACAAHRPPHWNEGGLDEHDRHPLPYPPCNRSLYRVATTSPKWRRRAPSRRLQRREGTDFLTDRVWFLQCASGSNRRAVRQTLTKPLLSLAFQ